jgi:uncharacterized protein YjbI with pentapeptide repeats
MKRMHRSEVEAVVATARAKGERPILTGVYLPDVNLRDADLIGVNLTDVNLNDAHLADDPVALVDHEISEVRVWAAEHASDADALLHLATDADSRVRAAVVDNVSCPPAVAAIAALIA